MSKETEAVSQKRDNSSDTIELRLRQEPEMVTQGTETYASELTLRSFDELIKQASDPFLRQVEDLCAPLAGRIEMESLEQVNQPVRDVTLHPLALT